jgi:hypothetical protein
MADSIQAGPSDRNIARWAVSKIVAAQKLLPGTVGIHLVDEYGALLPAVTGEIGLRITLKIELADDSPTAYGACRIVMAAIPS